MEYARRCRNIRVTSTTQQCGRCFQVEEVADDNIETPPIAQTTRRPHRFFELQIAKQNVKKQKREIALLNILNPQVRTEQQPRQPTRETSEQHTGANDSVGKLTTPSDLMVRVHSLIIY
jgi:hypothetical protein